MNQLIQRLIEEATTQEAYYPAGCNGYPEYRSEFNKEKFAELIVQECCKVVRDEIQYQDSYDMADGVIDGVKNYFGVES
jgi:hypothetical protein